MVSIIVGAVVANAAYVSNQKAIFGMACAVACFELTVTYLLFK